MKKIYWDSCAFIHAFKGSQEYAAALQEQIVRAKIGDCIIVTSTVTLAEVYKLPELGGVPTVVES